MEQSTGGAIPKKSSDQFVKNVLLLNIGDYHRVRGQVCMPTKSEMATTRARPGQFKKDVEFHARMSEDMVKKKLEEMFPYLKDKGCFCAAKVNVDNDSSRFDFDGTPHLWDGRTIRRKIQGNSTLYILEDDQMDTSGISGSDPESTQEEFSGLIPWLQDNLHFEVSINPNETRLKGGVPCRFTFNPELHPDVTSGRATFGNLGTVQLERVSDGLLGTIPASPVPGLVTVILESQHGIRLGQTHIRYHGVVEFLEKTVFSPDPKKTFEELMHWGLGVTSEETQNSGILGFTEPDQLLSLLVYTAAKVGAQQFIEIIFNTSSGRIVFDAYKERSPLPEVVARDHGNEETAHYLEGITKRFSAEIRTGQECPKTIEWPELVKAAEAAQKRLDPASEEENYPIKTNVSTETGYLEDVDTSSRKDPASKEENYPIRTDVPKETGYLGDVDTSSSGPSEPHSSDSEDGTSTAPTKGSISGQECEIRLQRDCHLGDRNGDTQAQLDVEILNKTFAGSIKGQECEIRLQSLRDLYLEDRNGDTQDQLDIHNKKFAEVKKDICPPLGCEEEIKHVLNSNLLNITSSSNLSEAEKQQDRKDLEDLKVKTRKAIHKMKVTVKSHRAAADDLDKVWKKCNTARVAGSTGGILGGLLTIAGGIAIVASAGTATPLILAGVGFGVVGAGTNMLTSLTEAAINSSKIKKAQKDWQETLDSINEVKVTVKKWLVEKEKTRLLYIWHLAEEENLTFSDAAVKEILQKEVLPSLEFTTQVESALGWAVAKATTGVVGKGVQASAQAAGGVLQRLVQTGARAVGGRLIAGVGAVYMLWDAKDLGYTIYDIVRNKGSDAARCLRQNADVLESALPVSSNNH